MTFPSTSVSRSSRPRTTPCRLQRYVTNSAGKTEGDVVPRHSVYYIIPKDNVDLDDLLEYLNSEEARAWLEAHCQKAHNDYYRLQSSVLKELPVPEEMGESYQTTLV